MGELLGGGLTALLGVTASNVSNLWLLLVLTSCCMLVTLPMLRLLPDDLDSLGGRSEEEGAPLLEEGPVGGALGGHGDMELTEAMAIRRGHSP